jgi:endonuclease/exonuclease/phosphatase (EEP) superfamily protein YafD
MIDTTIKLRTDYISTIESEWVGELVKSSIAWAYINGGFTTIKVVNNSYTNKDTRKDGMFIEEIDVQFSNSSFRQRL